MEVYVFIFNKFYIENSVEFNCNFGYYILVVRYYLVCIIFNYLFFWYRIIIVDEVFKKEIICRFRYGV